MGAEVDKVITEMDALIPFQLPVDVGVAFWLLGTFVVSLAGPAGRAVQHCTIELAADSLEQRGRASQRGDGAKAPPHCTRCPGCWPWRRCPLVFRGLGCRIAYVIWNAAGLMVDRLSS